MVAAPEPEPFGKIMQNTLRRKYTSLIAVAIIFAITGAWYLIVGIPEEVLTVEEAVFRIDIIPVGNGSYGYDIVKNGRLIVHQPYIPATQGWEGFSTEQDARRVADTVVARLKRHETPNITIEELLAMGLVK